MLAMDSDIILSSPSNSSLSHTKLGAPDDALWGELDVEKGRILSPVFL